jgi:5,6,7,8-tetrahydromethanopterin hydro-lyase
MYLKLCVVMGLPGLDRLAGRRHDLCSSGEEGRMLIGESFVGEGAEAAHVNTVLGDRAGPVGVAWATALATPRQGHTPFVAVLVPGVPVKPVTLFVNKASIDSDVHGALTWGAAQAGVAGGVADALTAGIIDPAEASTLLLIAAVWVNPAASDAGLVYANNRAATRQALGAARDGSPSMEDVLAAAARPANPYYTAPPASDPAHPGPPA